MRDVSIIGTGVTKFGELWDKSLRELGLMAGLEAIKDAGVSSADIDALYVGNMAAGSLVQQEHVSALIADYCDMAGSNVPSTRVEAASASGGVALRQAYMAIAGGFIDIAVVGGAEKMTDVSDSESAHTLSMGADEEWESQQGATFASLHAMMTQAHMSEFGTTREMLSEVAAKNHAHAALNPQAQFSFPIKPEAVSSSGLVADPLRMLDCAPQSDGAAAVVLCASKRAKEFSKVPVSIIGSGQASDTLSLHHRASLSRMPAIGVAAKRAFTHAGQKVANVNVAEIHDNFTISELIALEEIGLAERGSAGQITLDGGTALGGAIPVNTSGGLKARGHPPGATGVAQAVEIVQQLRGTAGERQVKGATLGLLENHGGTGATAVVHLLEAN
ncbi:MAG: thiolase domain-containing protein [Candidatus Poseidoniia archaeon]|nr:acetyl-CoA acetyltransferase [Euryarchaeota archaeon]MDP6489852.1 thiolase domain-containing protein [Candidatus Poseidoniia archaeon]MDP6533944.1 thiolase domain-containing protein [Candidatus Poseidoniia archaeon]MDP6835575.1 thiolase domain-containing protein [Candidatus Poseidoniia archaeon]HIH79455.1 thiolase domain-containing protein [Candidatus Poseidoniia archaeon]